MNICDFANSYIMWTVPPNPSDNRQPGHMPWGNSARIQLDARCEVVDRATGASEEFFLITPCRTEWMYREDTLFQVPNHEYVGAWSRTEAVGLGSMTQRVGQRQTTEAVSVKDAFTTSPSWQLRPDHPRTSRVPPQARRTSAEVSVRATIDNLPLDEYTEAVTEMEDEARRARVVMEYPVKTMNIHPERVRYQVDTGPLLFTDSTVDSGRAIERMRMAFVCYNAPDVAEFVLRTRIDAGGLPVDEYTEVRRLQASNAIYAADPA